MPSRVSSVPLTHQVLTLARANGLIRPRDLAAIGAPRTYLVRLCQQGQLERVARGLYRPVDFPATEFHSLAQVSKRLPGGVICLLSALRYHDLTTQAPGEVWVALSPKARRPRAADLPVRVVRFSPPVLTPGSAVHVIDGVPVRVTTPAKTVADCFKYRRKLGLDIAVEALRAGLRERRFSIDELWRMARLCRVAVVMRPYIEALTT